MAGRYYLETSSVRSAGRRLGDIRCMADCFTSAFVLFEFITEITKSEREFNVRKACIVSLLDSGIHIELLLDTDRLKAAFPILGHKPDHIGTFWRVLECVKDTKSISEFERLVADRQLTDYLERLEREHADIVVAAMKIREDGGLQEPGLEIIEKYRPGATKKEKRKLLKRGRDITTAYWSASGNRYLIEALAYICAAQSIPDATEDDVERTAASYNGSVDVFIRAWGHALDECQFGGYTPDENDFADLLHLMYLSDEDVLVSEERDTKLVTRAAREAGIRVQHVASLLEG